MKYNEISNLSDILEEGFFSDKVVRLNQERKSHWTLTAKKLS